MEFNAINERKVIYTFHPLADCNAHKPRTLSKSAGSYACHAITYYYIGQPCTPLKGIIADARYAIRDCNCSFD